MAEKWAWGRETIGPLLAAARERRGLSQAELGRRLGVSGANLSRIERGADLRISTLLDIARALDLEPILVPKSAVPAVLAVLREPREGGDADERARGRFTE